MEEPSDKTAALHRRNEGETYLRSMVSKCTRSSVMVWSLEVLAMAKEIDEARSMSIEDHDENKSLLKSGKKE